MNPIALFILMVGCTVALMIPLITIADKLDQLLRIIQRRGPL